MDWKGNRCGGRITSNDLISAERVIAILRNDYVIQNPHVKQFPSFVKPGCQRNIRFAGSRVTRWMVMRQDDRRAGQNAEGRAENELWIYGGSVDTAA